MIPVAIDTFGTVPKGLERELKKLEIGGGIDIIETKALLGVARVLKKVLETREDLLLLRIQ